MSKKRQREYRIYRVLSQTFLAEHPFCQRPGCMAMSQCIHHFAGRGANYLNVSTWRASCNACNLWAKNNPKAAREIGWIAPANIYAG